MDLRSIHRLLGAAAVALAAATLVTPVFAGRSCEATPSSVEVVKKGIALAKRTQAALEAAGQQVYILGRAGQDLTKYGLTFSHLAFVMRDPQDNTWTVYHELNECGTSTSRVFEQGLLEFYSDDPFEYKGAVVTLPGDVQKRVAERLLTAPKAFHEPSYSVVAYPFATKHQNSNQWLLETLASAMSSDFKIQGREQAQAWLKGAGFEPSELHIGTMERLGGRVFKAQVYFDDHPGDLRWADRIRTTTAESVFQFLENRYPADYKLDIVELY